MVNKLNWFFFAIMLFVCTNHLIGTGYFVGRSISYRIKAARREEEINHKQDVLRLALESLNRYQGQIQKLHLIYKNPDWSGARQAYDAITWWLDEQRVSADTSGLPGQSQMTISEYFDYYWSTYKVPNLGVMSTDSVKNSRYACYALLVLSGIFMLVVLLGSHVE